MDKKELANAVEITAAYYKDHLSDIFNMLYPLSQVLEKTESYEAIKYVKGISLSCYQMLRSTFNLYQLFQDDENSVALEDVDLSWLFERVCKAAELLLSSNDVVFTYEISSEPIITAININNFISAVMNILSNSASYTNIDKKVHLKLYSSDGFAVFNISDNGIGMSNEEISKSFEPFHSDDKNLPFEKSLGIGIPVAHKVISSLGGTIMVTSQKSEGSAVTVKIPLKRTGKAMSGLKSSNLNFMSDRFSPVHIGLANICDLSNL